jgi:hypothetical protein
MAPTNLNKHDGEDFVDTIARLTKELQKAKDDADMVKHEADQFREAANHSLVQLTKDLKLCRVISNHELNRAEAAEAKVIMLEARASRLAISLSDRIREREKLSDELLESSLDRLKQASKLMDIGEQITGQGCNCHQCVVCRIDDILKEFWQ